MKGIKYEEKLPMLNNNSNNRVIANLNREKTSEI